MPDADAFVEPDVGALRVDDRVLLLYLPAFEAVALLARILARGVLVALGTRDEIDRARQHFAEFENVMFIEGDAAQIPWRDSYFTKVFAAPGSSATAEVARVLAPGGIVLRSQ